MIGEIAHGCAVGFPIEIFGRLAEQSRDLICGDVLFDAHAGWRAAFEAGEFANRVVFDERLEAAELAGRALPAAGLPDAVVFLQRFHQQATFGEPPGERFFSIDILAGVGAVDADPGVPVVWSGKAHHIEARVLEQIAVLGVDLAVLVFVKCVHLGFGGLGFIGIHVTDRHDSHALDVEEIRHVSRALTADPDTAHGDFIVGRTCLAAQTCQRSPSEGCGTGRKELAAWE